MQAIPLAFWREFRRLVAAPQTPFPEGPHLLIQNVTEAGPHTSCWA